MLYGGKGNDDLDTTPASKFGINDPGHDVYFGGAGNDNIASWGDVVTKTGRVKGHVRDYVYCGAGYDTVYADRLDYVAGDCEKLIRR